MRIPAQSLMFACLLAAPIAAMVPALLLPAPAQARLAPPTPEQKAAAEETAAKEAWNTKVAAYQLCQASDRVAEKYRADMKAQGKPAPQPAATPACTDPGPYTSPVLAAGQKPIEQAGAHSPPAPAAAPHNSSVPQASMK
jgi:hypothetical protein